MKARSTPQGPSAETIRAELAKLVADLTPGSAFVVSDEEGTTGAAA